MSQDVVTQFLEFMQSHGCDPAPHEILKPDSGLQRFDLSSDHRGEKSGWYNLHMDFPASGVCGRWQEPGVSYKWTISTREPLDAEANEKLKRRIEADRQRRKRAADELKLEAARRASEIWREATSSDSHPYLERKQIKAHRARIWRDLLVVPVTSDGKMVGLQFIQPDGEKRFITGTPKAGAFFRIGDETDHILICEGFATGASLHEATGLCVFVAFDAGNLEPVASVVRKRYPEARITVCADDDRFKPERGNAGVTHANRAAELIGGSICVPSFPSEEGKPTDFNDLRLMSGLDEVRRQVSGLSTFPAVEPTVMLPSNVQADNRKNAALHSEFFARMLSDRLLYDDFSGSWYVYSKVWTSKTEGDADREFLNLFDRAYEFNYGSRWFSDVKKLLKVRLGRSPMMSDQNEVVDTWNTDRNLLPMANGVLNIKTKELIPHDPKLMFNWFVPYDFDPDATCPNIDEFMRTLAQGEPGVEELAIAYLWAVLHGRSDFQKYLELIGRPGTGKSTFIHIAKKLVGVENTAVTTMATLHENRFETASLYGKRLVVITDADKWAGSIDTFKAVTGQDPIRYEVKNRQQGKPFVFGGMLIVAANSPIRSTDRSTALYRRRMTIYVDNFLAKEKVQERFLERIIDPEIPGLLNKLLALDEAKATSIIRNYELNRVRALTETHDVASWLVENCEFSEGVKTRIGSLIRDGQLILNADRHLYPNFVQYLEQNGIRSTVTLQDFSTQVLEVSAQLGHNVSKRKTMHGAVIENVTLRPLDSVTEPVTRLDTLSRVFRNPNL